MGIKDKLKELIQKYGKLAIGVHIGLSLISYSACYLFASYANLNSETFMKYFLKMEENTEESKGIKKIGTAAIAYVIYKATMPVRISLTMSVVGFIVKFKN